MFFVHNIKSKIITNIFNPSTAQDMASRQKYLFNILRLENFI